ncbi:MAG: hypothetical protein ABIP95_05225 [Pelobium sp.]
MIQKISDYANKNDCWKNEFMQGITFSKGYNLLLEAEKMIFNDENISSVNIIRNSTLNTQNLLSKIEIHNKGLNDIRTFMNFYLEDDESLLSRN